ncbi:MAG: DUF1097 family protein [Actinobacteria bacterium]|nr:DUF1097 family protein [Actinomycetota bacterium]
MNKYVRNAILAVILAVVAFFWIWFFDYLGAKAYWVALITFGVCMAYGPALSRSLPWMTLGGIVGVLLGMVTFYLFMLVFPLYYGLSVAIAGAIFILVAGLISIPKMREMLPMLLVGWGCFLGAVARFDYLLAEKPVEAIHRAVTTLFGVILSVVIGMLLAAILDALVLSPGKAEATQAPAAMEQ